MANWKTESAVKARAESETNSHQVISHRDRILRAALKLLADGGRDALTTRAVDELAGEQPPVLYHLFGDKRELMDAVAEHGFALYLAGKRRPRPDEDQVEFLREGWARHVNYGLAHPGLYLLMYANPQPRANRDSMRHEHTGLRLLMRDLALAGRLRVSEGRAADLFHASACGVVLELLAHTQGTRDMNSSTIA